MRERCRVVLVRTEVPGNMGATARLMRNFGLTDLALVAPVADPMSRDARRMSTRGEAILESAKRYPTLAEAVADRTLVVGSSARTGGITRGGNAGPPEQILPKVVATMRTSPVALIFGPEPNGLTNEEVALCHHLISIPADEGYPALNLSHAVGIVLYLLTRMSAPGTTTSDSAASSFAQRETMFTHLREGLEAVHFLYGNKADQLMTGVRRLIDRAGPTDTDLRILHGLARQLLWIAQKADDARHPG